MPFEMLDVVNDQDVVVGSVSRAKAWSDNPRWVRVINAFVLNARGELWIPRRSSHKALFPNCLDMSVGGHVQAGETYEAAFERETLEELNLNLSTLEWHELGYLNPETHGLSAWMKVFEIRTESVPDFNRNDFSQTYWLEPQALLERIGRGDPAKGDLVPLVHRFYGR
jgi:isopentenyldiphosphate isomerase